MAKEEKNKSGAGKFFLGAALGALAGAIAGKFISNKAEADKCNCDEDCKCGDKCDCDKAEKPAEKAKTTDKTDKKTTKKEA